MALRISSAFDGGNIEVVSAARADAIRLNIRRDAGSDFYQWFHFRVSGARDKALTMRIDNAGGAAYADGWKGYRACASYDRETWFRAPTDYDGAALTIRHTPERDCIYYAYFAPFSQERHLDLIARASAHRHVAHTVPGATLDGRDVDLLRIGAPGKGKRVCWIIARQHPGETMAEWWMEGALARLCDPTHPVTRSLLERACLYIVPNMNPDGSFRGHLRTNAAGVNLNREWRAPSLEKSPEVFHVLKAMDGTGVDFCLDVHGDEAIPYNFIAGFEGIPAITDAMTGLLKRYKDRLAACSPDFQTRHGYPPAQPGQANLTMCTNQVAQRFGCLAITLEMPFKDNDDLPDPVHAWSPPRCRHLAHACLDVLHEMVDALR